MKIVGIGIILIMLVGIAFFGTQLVKNPDMFNIAKNTKIGTVNDLTKTYIDVQKGFVFVYHPDVQMLYQVLPGYAPVFSTLPGSDAIDPQQERGYIAVAQKELQAFNSTQEEIEAYSDTVPIQSAVNTLLGGSAHIHIEEFNSMTFPNLIPGFTLRYSAMTDAGATAEGNIFFYRVRQRLMYAFSIYIDGQQHAVTSPESTEHVSQSNDVREGNISDQQKRKNLFLQYADSTLQSMSIQ